VDEQQQAEPNECRLRGSAAVIHRIALFSANIPAVSSVICSFAGTLTPIRNTDHCEQRSDSTDAPSFRESYRQYF